MTSVVAAASPRAAAAPAKATKHRKERLKLPRAPKLAPIDGAEEPAPAVPSLAAAAPAVACPFSPGARANVAGPRPASARPGSRPGGGRGGCRPASANAARRARPASANAARRASHASATFAEEYVRQQRAGCERTGAMRFSGERDRVAYEPPAARGAGGRTFAEECLRQQRAGCERPGGMRFSGDRVAYEPPPGSARSRCTPPSSADSASRASYAELPFAESLARSERSHERRSHFKFSGAAFARPAAPAEPDSVPFAEALARGQRKSQRSGAMKFAPAPAPLPAAAAPPAAAPAPLFAADLARLDARPPRRKSAAMKFAGALAPLDANATYAPEGAGILEKVRQQNYLAPKKRNLMKFA